MIQVRGAASVMLAAVFIACFSCTVARAGSETPDAVSAARGVLLRTIGPRAVEFELKQIEAADGRDTFEVEASGGAVRVRGTTGVAIARGAYEYLREACRCQVTWDGAHLTLPQTWPDYAARRVVCPNRYRHLFNVCTFGYTLAWWDWARWEREIDWMALHGVNMPLAMNGQESVWRDVWRQYGLTDDEIGAHFSGPAFLPWHRMGNLNGHAAPLPESWHIQQAELQKKILTRERELGMHPVTPAFSGFVPAGLARVRPDAKITRSSGWCGFAPTYMLDPHDPLYGEIGKRFIDQYRATYGSDHLYLADVFNEMSPQVSAEKKLDELASVGKAVLEAIRAGDPDGIWVMQGWLFYNERAFWGAPEVEAFLRDVPDERMMVIDLSCESMEVWRTHEAMRRKQWIWCLLHNFGQCTTMGGNLKHYVETFNRFIADEGRGNVVGVGTTPEGIEQNAVVYELVADMMWSDVPIDLSAWMDSYVQCRYGAASKTVIEAWHELLDTVYSNGVGHASYVRRPQFSGFGEPGDDAKRLRSIAEKLLSGADVLERNEAYRHDLVDVMKRYLDEIGTIKRFAIGEAFETRNRDAFHAARDEYLALLSDIDRLVGTRPEYRLSRWLSAARNCGNTPEEQAFFERNARMQVTVWGGAESLRDYAAKEWSGLISGFYIPRWKMLFDAMEAGLETRRIDAHGLARALEAWEWEWTKSTTPPLDPASDEDTIRVVRELLKRYPVAEVQVDRGIAVGSPVTSTGDTEGSHVASIVVDGRAGGGYWAAGGTPSSVQIDLQRVHHLGRIQVFPYADGVRYYQFRVEISTDGQTWETIIDQSHNTTPASPRGHRYEIVPTDARYVRVVMLKNSANPSVHLHEVRVFDAD